MNKSRNLTENLADAMLGGCVRHMLAASLVAALRGAIVAAGSAIIGAV